MSQPRRSSRIAARNAAKNTEQMASTNAVSKPTSMKEIEMELDEYWELNDGSEQSITHPSLCFSSNDSAEKLMATMKVTQERYRYLLQKSYLLEFFNEDMMDDLLEQIETFRMDYEDWTQELEKQMVKAVRNNKHWPISPTDPNTSFPVMSTIRKASKIHNLFVSVCEDLTYIKLLIKKHQVA